MKEHEWPGRGERAWVCEILEANRAGLDQLYEAHAPCVYRMALQCTASEAEAERVTEAVFLTVLRDLASWADGGPSVLLEIFGAAERSTAIATPRAVSTRSGRIASP